MNSGSNLWNTNWIAKYSTTYVLHQIYKLIRHAVVKISFFLLFLIQSFEDTFASNCFSVDSFLFWKLLITRDEPYARDDERFSETNGYNPIIITNCVGSNYKLLIQ
jgi:hypothetical protein